MEQSDSYLCVHWLKIRGLYKTDKQNENYTQNLEDSFKDADCISCTPDRHSSIICPYYISKRHLEFFDGI